MNTRTPLCHFLRAAWLKTTLALCLLLFAAFQLASAQGLSSSDRDRGRSMLKSIKEDIKVHYYDATYRGMDLDARFSTADEKMKQATSLGQVFGIIAQAMADLNDSHTFFIPPSRTLKTEYGWQMQIVGDTCYVTAVKPGSDAEAKGLKVGDAIVSLDGFGPTRENMWKLQYLYYTLSPKSGMRIVAQSPNGQERELQVMAKVRQEKQTLDMTLGDGGNDLNNVMREASNESRLYRHRFYELGDELFIWKMPQFDLTDQQVDEVMGKVGKRKSLILDLRGNPGGYINTLQRLTGYFFDHDVKIADLKGRKEMKPMMAKTRGDKIYKGNVLVLVDSRSASCAEMFSRVMQLEKRGTVIGDRTSGAVMQSRQYSHQLGVDIVSFFSSSITDADLYMTDGKSLENTGVMPDEWLLPPATDIAAQRDPVLSHAAEVAGVKIPADKAGALFPVEWNK